MDVTQAQIVRKLAAGRSFDAVVGPEGDLLLFDVFAGCLRVADGVFGYEGLCSRVLTGERDVVGRVAVSGGDYEFEVSREEAVDAANYVAAIFDGECAVLLSLAEV